MIVTTWHQYRDASGTFACPSCERGRITPEITKCPLCEEELEWDEDAVSVSLRWQKIKRMNGSYPA